jgi:hypothetical protein
MHACMQKLCSVSSIRLLSILLRSTHDAVLALLKIKYSFSLNCSLSSSAAPLVLDADHHPTPSPNSRIYKQHVHDVDASSRILNEIKREPAHHQHLLNGLGPLVPDCNFQDGTGQPRAVVANVVEVCHE